MFRWWSCHHTHRRIFCFGIGTAYTQHTQHSPLYLFVRLCFLHAFAQITSRSFFFFFRLYNASYNTHYKHIYICTLLTLCYEHYSCVYNSNRFYYTRKMFRLRRRSGFARFKTRKQHFFTNFICFFFVRTFICITTTIHIWAVVKYILLCFAAISRVARASSRPACRTLWVHDDRSRLRVRFVSLERIYNRKFCFYSTRDFCWFCFWDFILLFVHVCVYLFVCVFLFSSRKWK